MSDGTPTGTSLVKDIEVGSGSSTINDLTPLGERVAFRRGQFGSSQSWVWESDGSAEGTRSIDSTYLGLADNLWPVAGGVVYVSSLGTYIDVTGYDGAGRPTSLGRLGAVWDRQPQNSDGTTTFLTGRDAYTAQRGVYAVDLNGIQFIAQGVANGAVADGEGGVYYADRNTYTLVKTIRHIAAIGDEPREVYTKPQDDYPVVAFASGARAIVQSLYGADAGDLLFADGRPDGKPPEVITAAFSPEPTQQVQVAFTEDVAASLSPSDLLLQGAATGVATAVAYDEVTDTATFVFLGLPDGNYTATLPAGSVSDAAGNPLAEDATFDFFVLAGDADRDQDVDFFDFLKLRSNYGTSGKLFSDGDFDYDGDVDFFDFLILRGNYGVTLPPPQVSGSLFDDGGDSGGL